MSATRRPNTLPLAELRPAGTPDKPWVAGLILVEHIVMACEADAQTTRVQLSDGSAVVVNMPLERFSRRLSLDNAET
jgi:hypothetical protein